MAPLGLGGELPISARKGRMTCIERDEFENDSIRLYSNGIPEVEG